MNFEDDIAFILCSSGSTGLCKAICLSQANALAGPKMKYTGTVSLTFSSLYWMSGIMSVVTGTVDGIPRVFTRHPFSPDLFLDIVEKHKVGFWYGSPTNFAQLLKSPRLKTADLSSLRTVASIGASLTEHYKTEMEKYVPRCGVSYGMTELGNVACMSLMAYKPGSVGTPMMNLSLRVSSCDLNIKKCNFKPYFKVVDDDNGEILDRHQVGEIQAKTPFKFLGYYKNETATRSVLTADGFYKTGDLGYIDEEGLVYIVGRKKEIMKYANVAIAPLELEQILCQHPGILECCITGIPSEEFGCLIAALVVKLNGSLVTEQQVEDFFNAQVQDAKRLRGGVYFVDSIPQTQSGKPRRNEVQNLVIQLKERQNTN
jgi:4-coumarate--CoA ligase